MTPAEREHALALLSDPDLATRVAEAFSALGLVGEKDAALVAWLVLVSRLADRPLGAVVQSSSAAGKSTLAEAALSLIPAEQKAALECPRFHGHLNNPARWCRIFREESEIGQDQAPIPAGG